MNKFKNRLVIFSIISIGAIVLITVIITRHPLFRSPQKILADTLRITPMGMHIDDVVEIVTRQTIIRNVNEWRSPLIKYDSGYIDPSSRSTSKSSIVGHKSVRVSYKTHFNTYISIYWGFDEDGNLIDVLVDKSYDMIEVPRARMTAN